MSEGYTQESIFGGPRPRNKCVNPEGWRRAWIWRNHLDMTAAQAQKHLVSKKKIQQIHTQHYLISTILNSTILVFNTSPIQQAQIHIF